jgi:hypothetical protein
MYLFAAGAYLDESEIEEKAFIELTNEFLKKISKKEIEELRTYVLELTDNFNGLVDEIISKYKELSV